jgi:hypothetical protein
VADEVGNGGPHLRLLEYRHNLLDTEAFSFHGILLPLPRGDYAGNPPSNRYQNRGADQALTPRLSYGTVGPDYGDRANLYETTPLFQKFNNWHPDQDKADRLLEQYRRQNGAR